MRHGFFTLLLLGLAVLLAPATAGESFDYAGTEDIIAVTDDDAHLYARFPTFIEFRDRLVKISKRLGEPRDRLSESIYTLELLAAGKRQTLFVGKDWLSDGSKVATLSEAEFAWIDGVIRFREKGNTGIALERLDQLIEGSLEEQRSRMHIARQ